MSKTKAGPQRNVSPEHQAGGPVLVGFDGSEGGRDALELARVLGSAEHARCLVGTCLTFGPVGVRTGNSDEVDPDAAALFAEAREALAGIEVETHVVGSRSPARRLAETAERERARTLVVGSPHRGHVGRTLLGSVAEHVIHHAPCEVVVAPRGYATERHERLARIAVAFDGTPESAAALERGEDLARECGASLEILVAEDPVVATVEARDPATEPTSAEAVLDRALKSVDPAISVAGRELNPGWRQVVSEVAKGVADACEESGVDLLIVGTRRSTDRFFFGSVAKHLVDLAPTPVLVVPEPE